MFDVNLIKNLLSLTSQGKCHCVLKKLGQDMYILAKGIPYGLDFAHQNFCALSGPRQFCPFLWICFADPVNEWYCVNANYAMLNG